MKATKKNQPTDTMPDGVWESSVTDKKDRKTKKEHKDRISTDEQGNGYPTNSSGDHKAQ